MNEAENLRSKADRALRLARSIPDQQTIQALKTLAANLMEQADNLDQKDHPLSAQVPPQQQQQQPQQGQRPDEDKE
jgi:hypothetical protein